MACEMKLCLQVRSSKVIERMSLVVDILSHSMRQWRQLSVVLGERGVTLMTVMQHYCGKQGQRIRMEARKCKTTFKKCLFTKLETNWHFGNILYNMQQNDMSNTLLPKTSLYFRKQTGKMGNTFMNAETNFKWYSLHWKRMYQIPGVTGTW